MKKKDYNMTVKDLKEALIGIPDDYKVYYQRIEDVYFEKHGWSGKKMRFDETGFSEYVRAFSAYAYYKKRQKAFIINAHY